MAVNSVQNTPQSRAKCITALSHRRRRGQRQFARCKSGSTSLVHAPRSIEHLKTRGLHRAFAVAQRRTKEASAAAAFLNRCCRRKTCAKGARILARPRRRRPRARQCFCRRRVCVIACRPRARRTSSSSACALCCPPGAPRNCACPVNPAIIGRRRRKLPSQFAQAAFCLCVRSHHPWRFLRAVGRRHLDPTSRCASFHVP